MPAGAARECDADRTWCGMRNGYSKALRNISLYLVM